MKTVRLMALLAAIGSGGLVEHCKAQSVQIENIKTVEFDGVYRAAETALDSSGFKLRASAGSVITLLEITTGKFDAKTTVSGQPGSADRDVTIWKGDYNRTLSIRYQLKSQDKATTSDPVVKDNIINIHIDSSPPKLKNPSVEVFPGGALSLTVEFEDNDVNTTSVSKMAFSIKDVTAGTNNVREIRPISVDFADDSNRFVVLSFPRLTPGTYSLTPAGIRDVVGKPIDVGTLINFEVPSGALQGELVEYPDFLPQGGKQKTEFDPGDRVDTRVVQLYYLRDARQIAELINRNIQDLNAVGYDDAQRAAANARKIAENAIDSRRFQDERAVDAARKARETERKLEDARQQFEQLQRDLVDLERRRGNLEQAARTITGTNADTSTINTSLEQNQTAIINQISKVESLKIEIAERQKMLAAELAATTPRTSEIDRLRAEIAAREKQKETEQQLLIKLQNNNSALATLKTELSNVTTIKGDLDKRKTALDSLTKSDGLPAQLAREQESEIAERQKVTRAEADELRASQEQFRREVAAGLADRNSFVAGKLASIDPVAQCSISVVGTSRLQLRGPIKGLNKICRMIHQLDSPVGQVKIGIHTIQVNGEHGDRMEVVYERINREIDHSRFLVNATGQLLRRAVQEVADEVALEADAGMLPEDCPPELRIAPGGVNGMLASTRELRDRRYLYAFYGSDFIGELEEMDSELLNTDNKLLSLHSMDTISLAGAMFVVAHADHPIRQRIIMRFQELIAGDLPQREIEYVRALTQLTDCGHPLKYHQNQARKIDEREARAICFNNGRTYTFPNTSGFFVNQIHSVGTLTPPQLATIKLAQGLKAYMVAELEHRNLLVEQSLLETKQAETEEQYEEDFRAATLAVEEVERQLDAAEKGINDIFNKLLDGFSQTAINDDQKAAVERIERRLLRVGREKVVEVVFTSIAEQIDARTDNDAAEFAVKVAASIGSQLSIDEDDSRLLVPVFTDPSYWSRRLAIWNRVQEKVAAARRHAAQTKARIDESREKLLSKRMLLQFIDEQEEKSVNLMEALRSHASNVDNYIKRLAIAMEDDINAQFYEPAFQRVRNVSRSWDVTLGQIETTSVLTNNRTLAKVSPAASFEFDLPKREILITEAMQGAKGVAKEYGNLLKDPTFISASELLKARTAEGVTGENSPYSVIPGLNNTPEFGSELEKLIEPPAIYKFETGTGFEIRPVIQPDGSSITYTFDYQYSTQVREPVRADEKHLGRIKRHFVHTEVQTGCYEIREISRYTVALKAARTDRGVPLLQDIPFVGAAFRPLPSEESSLQTNIILGSSTVYPTIFDLMGLRWSPYVDGEGQTELVKQKQSSRERASELKEKLLLRARNSVNEAIHLDTQP